MAGRRKLGQPPAYLLHKTKGLAYVNLEGKLTYLGAYGSPESKRRYEEILKTWRLRDARDATPYVPRAGCTVAELVAGYMEHAVGYYRRADGTQTGEVAAFALSCRPLIERYASLPCNDFAARDLKAIQGEWVKAGLARKTINKQIGRIRRVFKWGIVDNLCSESTAVALTLLRDLGKNRSAARDNPPVLPVNDTAIKKTLKHCNQSVVAMIRLQLLAGPRPGEICRMHKSEINTDGQIVEHGRTIQLEAPVWVFKPTIAKTKDSCYYLNKEAQELLTPFLEAADSQGGYLFSPATEHKRLAEQRRAKAHSRRYFTRAVNPKRAPGDFYRPDSYGHAIVNASAKAGVEPWTPNQLRHNFLTRMDKAHGIQLASYTVGHKSTNTSAIYIEHNHQAAANAVCIPLDAA